MPGEPLTALFEMWTSRLSCGHWTRPVGTGGVPYGRAREGSWISCHPCQGQRKVEETLAWDEAPEHVRLAADA